MSSSALPFLSSRSRVREICFIATYAIAACVAGRQDAGGLSRCGGRGPDPSSRRAAPGSAPPRRPRAARTTTPPPSTIGSWLLTPKRRRLQQPAGDERRRQPDCRRRSPAARARRRSTVAGRAPGCADGHADPDLAGPARHRVGRDAVEPEARQQQRDAAERDRQPRDQALDVELPRHLLVHRRHAADGEAAVDVRRARGAPPSRVEPVAAAAAISIACG